MCKCSSGRVKGTVGAKGAGGGGAGNTPPLFDNGHVTKEGIAAHREELMGKSVEQIAEMLKQQGYEVTIRDSKLKKNGSKAKVIETINPPKGYNIKQVQVSPGGGRHGKAPYVKISTSNRRIKVIDGSPQDYKTSGNEKAVLIFKED